MGMMAQRSDPDFAKRPTIGVLFEGVNSYTDLIWSGIAEKAEEQSINTLAFAGQGLTNDPENITSSNIIYQLANEHNLDGLIILTAEIGDYISHQELTDFCYRFSPLPVISLGEKIEGISNLLVDNQKGLQDLVLHLIDEHGAQQIAFFKGPENNPEAQGRFQAYQQALADRNILLDEALIVQGPFTYAQGQAATEELLRRGVDFDAIVSVNDLSAWGVMDTLYAHGLHVPNDVAVIGFDDTVDSRYAIPPLSTVRQPLHQLGVQVFEMLLAHLRGEQKPQEITLDTEMIVRQSCGCLSPAVERVRMMKLVHTESNEACSLAAQRETVQQDLLQALESLSATARPWIKEQSMRLFDAFCDDIAAGSSGEFLSVFDIILRQWIANSEDLDVLQDVLSVIRFQVLRHCTANVEIVQQMETLWQQARILLSDIAQQAQVRRRLEADIQTRLLFDIKDEVITTFDLPKLMDALTDALDQLGISFCYLCLNDTPEAATGLDRLPAWSRLIFAYLDGEPRDLELGGVRFPTEQFLPKGILPDNRRYDMLVFPLRFQDHYLGHAVFEMGARDGFIYDALQIQISSAVWGASLIQQLSQARSDLECRVEERTAELQNEIAERVKAEEAIRANEQRYRALFEQTNDAIFLTDFEGIYLQVNQQTVDLLGYTIEEMVGTSYSKYAAPGDLSDGKAKFQALVAGETFPVYERVMRHKDGHLIPVEMNAALVRDPAGKPLHIQSVVRDISKRKRTERILHAFNLASLAMRQAITPEEIFETVGNELKTLGFGCAIFRTNHDLSQISPTYLNYEGKVVAIAEKLLNVHTEEFVISTKDVEMIRRPIWERETIFSNINESIHQVLPKHLKSIAKQAVRLLNVPHSIHAPLVVDKQMMGMLSVQSNDLTEEDIPAVTAFAHQMAASWQKARLLRDLETSLLEQKRVEESLRENEEKYRTLFDLSPEAIVVIGLNGIILDANQTAVKLGGKRKEKFIGRSILDIGVFDKGQSSEYLDLFSKLISNEIDEPTEIRLKMKNNEWRWIEIHPALLKKGDDVLALQLILDDVTEQKRIEQERQALTEVQQIVAGLSARFINLSMLEIEDEINQALQIIGEYAQADACSVWMVSEDKSNASKTFGWPSTKKKERNQDIPLSRFPWTFGKMLDNGSVAISGKRDVPSDANDMHQLLSDFERTAVFIVPLISEGDVIGTLGIYMQEEERRWPDELESLLKIIGDIIVNALERKRAEENIRQLNEELEQRVIQRTQQLEAANQELEAFAYSVSHDLRAPLRAIDGFSLALIEDYGHKLDKNAENYLNRVRTASQRMGQLIDDLLRLSRVTRNEMAHQEVDLSELVRHILAELQETEPNRNINFTIQSDLAALGDEHLLQIMLVNLCSNAWKFTNKKEQALIEFGCLDKENPRTFFISDNGVGFDMAYANKLFGTFQRLHTTSDFEGTGIGLATVKRIVQRHGGRVWAEGEVDHGATFYFTLGETP